MDDELTDEERAKRQKAAADALRGHQFQAPADTETRVVPSASDPSRAGVVETRMKDVPAKGAEGATPGAAAQADALRKPSTPPSPNPTATSAPAPAAKVKAPADMTDEELDNAKKGGNLGVVAEWNKRQRAKRGQ